MSPHDFSLPEQLGPYRIVKPLGRGGMGAVYLALDTKLGREVALKICARPDSYQGRMRFEREARAAARLSHPNLCPVFEFTMQSGIALLAMAYIEGPTLAERMLQQPFNQREAILLIAKLSTAMAEAHEKGVIHRDLKPANIVFDRRGEPIILDFGLARLDTEQPLTDPGTILGTVIYMSPEQAAGEVERVHRTADIYSLGVILYELLTGTVPFSGPRMAVAMQKNIKLPDSPRQRNSAVDPGLEAVCLRALAKEPKDRYPSMQQFAIALLEVEVRLPPLAAAAVPIQARDDSSTSAIETYDPLPSIPPTLPTSTRRPTDETQKE